MNQAELDALWAELVDAAASAPRRAEAFACLRCHAGDTNTAFAIRGEGEFAAGFLVGVIGIPERQAIRMTEIADEDLEVEVTERVVFLCEKCSRETQVPVGKVNPFAEFPTVDQRMYEATRHRAAQVLVVAGTAGFLAGMLVALLIALVARD